MVYGSDSVKPFDYCTLCLHHVSLPMCWYVATCYSYSPSDEGHLFCKECALKYLLTKKKLYEEQMREYEAAMVEINVSSLGVLNVAKARGDGECRYDCDLFLD